MANDNNGSWLNRFIGRRSISKTLRFELRPIGKTLENIESGGFLKRDEDRASEFAELKELINDYHKDFIEKALADCQIDWTDLKEEWDRRKDATEDKDSFEGAAQSYRKQVAKLFSSGGNRELYNKIFDKELIEELLPEFLKNNNNYSSADIELVEKFKGFTTYLKGFHENRKNIYSGKREATAIGYRVVHENFPKFVNNLEVFRKIKERDPGIIKTVESNLAAELQGKASSLNEVFKLDFFNKTLTQSGIDFYNLILGGVSGSEGTRKVQGLNELVNLHNQQHPEERLPRFVPLYKQILSDRESFSFRPEPFESDNDLIESLRNFCVERLELQESETPIRRLSEAMVRLNRHDQEKMRVGKNDLSKISHKLFSSWDRLMEIRKDTCGTEKEKADCEKKKFFTFKELNDALERKNQYLSEVGEAPLDVENIHSYWDMGDIRKKIDESYESLKGLLVRDGSDVKLSEADIEKIKEFLDAVLDFYHKIEMLLISKDEDFLGEVSESADFLSEIIPLYNKIRNYVTQKPGDKLEKYKLTFGNPILGTGWAKSVEKAKGCIILLRGGNYYLGVFNSKNKPDIDNISRSGDGDVYQKMVYQQVSKPARDIPNLMQIDGKTVRKTGGKDSNGENKVLEELKNKHLPAEVNRIRKSQSFLPNEENFRKEDLAKYIEYYMARIREYKSEIAYDFEAPDKYGTWSDFLNDVKGQSYKITFEPIPCSALIQLVDEGKIFLFQIYNKDFSERSYGKPNLHTLYWKMVFDPENLKNTVIQLCGGAELFYRKGDGEKKSTHARGSVLLNRQTEEGVTIPSEIYKELFDFFNGKKKESELSDDARGWKERAVTKTATHDIVKDKRFIEPKFKFHVPLGINFQESDGDSGINNDVLSALRLPNQRFTVLGIDRGERNLIYITLVDQDGKILLQKSLNQVEYTRSDNKVNRYDYHEKLGQREKERDKSRKSWKTIGTIKELKEGYISQIVHEIAKIVVEHSAVIVMEDLSMGFKRGRFHVEKQVYQKFEKALLEKLNYLVFKDRKVSEPGGVLKGYQLTQKFESFRDMRNQSGILFYVPAAYTSRIDPTTGFTNPLGRIRYESVEKTKRLIRDKIRSFRYNPAESYFEFEVPESRGKKASSWQVCTHGNLRWAASKEKGKWVVKPVNVTEGLKTLFEKHGISYEGGQDLISSLCDQQQKDFFGALCNLLNLTLQLRYSNSTAEGKDQDFILSPVKNKEGKFFDSRLTDGSLPQDADANGAYHIALKGLYHIKSEADEINKKGFDKRWLEERRQSLR
ncbi:MAG: type V CRISPR-associated protein Cas12a/Cpf1 [Thermoguttaceae bacterium]|jgi:CRISPR-associated protein Cpf1